MKENVFKYAYKLEKELPLLAKIESRSMVVHEQQNFLR